MIQWIRREECLPPVPESFYLAYSTEFENCSEESPLRFLTTGPYRVVSGDVIAAVETITHWADLNEPMNRRSSDGRHAVNDFTDCMKMN